jgi:hypothetical protein
MFFEQRVDDLLCGGPQISTAVLLIYTKVGYKVGMAKKEKIGHTHKL